jgi:2-amino-4-hydroxy-6-hydroxymethyldihydropteridine diphosphokinase
MTDSSELAFLSLGSNIDPETHLPAAVRAVQRLGAIRAVSPALESPAWGPTPQPAFVNAAVLLDTLLAPLDLRTGLRFIEASLGRVRTPDRYAPRTIDLDLCLLGARVIDNDVLTLPDPALLERPYLAATLAALFPDFTHPVTGETLQSIARHLAQGADLRELPELTGELRRAAGLDTGASGLAGRDQG